MAYDKTKLMEKLIEKAKLVVIRNYEKGETTDRPWLECEPANSYDNENYRMRLIVLSGSPPKGHIVVNYAYELVRAYDCCNKHLVTYHLWEWWNKL